MLFISSQDQPIRYILYPVMHIHSTALLRRNSDSSLSTCVQPHACGSLVIEAAFDAAATGVVVQEARLGQVGVVERAAHGELVASVLVYLSGFVHARLQSRLPRAGLPPVFQTARGRCMLIGMRCRIRTDGAGNAPTCNRDCTQSVAGLVHQKQEAGVRHSDSLPVNTPHQSCRLRQDRTKAIGVCQWKCAAG
jgi:hypothetical protein